MDELIEHDELIDEDLIDDDLIDDDLIDDEDDEDDEAPMETKTTFWGTLTEFVSALLMGIPA